MHFPSFSPETATVMRYDTGIQLLNPSFWNGNKAKQITERWTTVFVNCYLHIHRDGL